MLKVYPSGQNSDLVRLPLGIDTVSDLATMPAGRAQKLDNMQYESGKLTRRKPWTEYNATALGAEVSDIIDYIDGTDTERVLVATMDGKITEVTTTTITDRVTGLNASQKGMFAQLGGALFHQNGFNTPRRIDSTTARVAGGLTPPTALTLGAVAGGVKTGAFIWAVTAVYKVGAVAVLESDLSNLVTATLAAQQQTLSWTNSVDTRVTHHRLYVSLANQGSPLYLVSEVAVATATATDNTADAALSAQKAPALLQNGTMPISKYIAVAGQRLVCGNLLDSADQNASKSVHISQVATTIYNMEYFPNDGVSRFYLPTNGEITFIGPYSVKDELQNNKDLLIAQTNAMYLLRGCDPNGALETISTTTGIKGPRAGISWGRYFFFVSNRGLEFINSNGDCVLLSAHINSIFFGGGPMELTAANGNDLFRMAIQQNRLLITYRDNVSYNWGNKTLVMDLERFQGNTQGVNPVDTVFFTLWYANGANTSHWVALKSGEMLLLDNQNKKLLKIETGIVSQDKINGANQNIYALVWSYGVMSQDPGSWTQYKSIRRVNVMQLSQVDCKMDIEADYDYYDARNLTIPRFVTTESWDKVWDKAWGGSPTFLSSVITGRNLRGRFFQFKILCDGQTENYIFIGFMFLYTTATNTRILKR